MPTVKTALVRPAKKITGPEGRLIPAPKEIVANFQRNPGGRKQNNCGAFGNPMDFSGLKRKVGVAESGLERGE